MRRREFIASVGGAAAWPLVAARAQQSATPAIGFLNGGFAEGYTTERAAFLSGLDEAGYVDGRNVTIEYRWAEGQTDRLPTLADDLVQRQVAVIAATSTPAALAAKAATKTIPIVFETGGDPIQLGLVASLNQPGSNVTGITQLNLEVSPKRLELLHEIMPAARLVVLVVNPRNPTVSEASANQMQAAARTLGLDLRVINASNDDEVEAAFAKAVQMRVPALPRLTCWRRRCSTTIVSSSCRVLQRSRCPPFINGLPYPRRAASSDMVRVLRVFMGTSFPDS